MLSGPLGRDLGRPGVGNLGAVALFLLPFPLLKSDEIILTSEGVRRFLG